MLSRFKKALIFINIAIVFISTSHANNKAKIELHTHFRGILPSTELLGLALEDGNIKFPTKILDEFGIPYPENKKITIQGQQYIPFNKSNFGSASIKRLKKNMELNPRNKNEFNDLERAYALRRPLTDIHPDNIYYQKRLLERIARNYQKNGISYSEISISHEVFFQEWIEMSKEWIPIIEKETGVKLRFLVGIRRSSPLKKTEEIIKMIEEGITKNHFVVGVDFLGEEINPTSEFSDQIRRL